MMMVVVGWGGEGGNRLLSFVFVFVRYLNKERYMEKGIEDEDMLYHCEETRWEKNRRMGREEEQQRFWESVTDLFPCCSSTIR